VNDSDRKHVSLSQQAIVFLESYKRTHALPNFSATVERAASALKREALIEGYEQFAADHVVFLEMQLEAESWLAAPMLEVDQTLEDDTELYTQVQSALRVQFVTGL
jgi:hypothetical protein